MQKPVHTETPALPCIIEFPKIGSSGLGYISVAEVEKNIPFDIKRVYWTYYTPDSVLRGGHAHKKLRQVIFAVGGRIEFNLETFHGQRLHFVLDQPNMGLYIPELVWRDIRFSHSAVLLCLASEIYLESDYFRNYEDFKLYQP